MTPNTNTNTNDSIPEALRRSPSEPGQKTAAQAAVEAKAAPVLKTETKPTPAPKKAKAATPRKGKVVDAAHKPATVTATDKNPQKSIVPVRFKQKYADHGDTNGDRVALALKAATTTKNEDGRDALDTKALEQIARANGIDFGAYKHLNAGQQRMNVGNRLRGMLKNEKPVVIGKQRFADWEKAKIVAPVAKVEKKAEAKTQAAA